MTYAGQADEPMGEFWSWSFGSGADWCTEMASAAHIYGKPILGAEAFTATDKEKWLGHPGSIKALGDWAFCEGINRFVFHRYALQPWKDVKPGMSMGPWGLHYERSQTWWDQSTAWHEYLSRCQFLLQQGQFVADICYLAPEASPYRFRAPPTPGSPSHRPGYNFDGCTPEVLLTLMKVKDGRLVLPSGMSYRVLVLPEVETMTPKLLRKVSELVKAGATVVGPAPLRSPGLSHYPECDQEVQKLARELWSGGAGEGTARLGKGRVLWPVATKPKQVVQEAPARLGTAKWIWFKEGNPAASAPADKRYFRRVFTLEAGAQVESARLVMTADNEFEAWVNGRRAGGGEDFRSHLRDGLQATARAGHESADRGGRERGVFAQPGGAGRQPHCEVSGRPHRRGPNRRPVGSGQGCHGQMAQRGGGAGAWKPAMELGAMGMEPWGNVDRPTVLTPVLYPNAEAMAGLMRTMGVPPDFDYLTQSSERSLRYIHKQIGQTDLFFVANEKPHPEEAVCSFRVVGKRPELWWPDSGRIERAAVYDEAGGCVRLPIRFDASGSVFVIFRAGEDVEPDRVTSVKRNGESLVDLGAKDLTAVTTAEPGIEIVRGQGDAVKAQVWQAGTYNWTSANGQRRQLAVASIPEPVEITGPWELRFPPKAGAPERVTLDQLISWSQHSDAGVRYFSGTATYRKQFVVPPALIVPGRRVYLDLGRVEVMASVKLNGKDLGILWKQPYCVEVTDALKAGANLVEVEVVNLWINRQIGDEQLPEDSERNPNGTLKQWPQWLEEGKPSPTGRYTFTSWRLWQKDSPLVESGLLGPVKLRVAQSVVVP